MIPEQQFLSANYVNESVEDLIKRAEDILARPDKTNDPLDRPGCRCGENPRSDIPVAQHMNPMSSVMQDKPVIASLSPSCNRIVVRNVINVIDSSIVICTGPTIADCPGTIPTACPTGVTPLEYINMLATINALTAQAGVIVSFKYLLNDVPTTTDVTVNLAAGNNLVYAFPTNIQYSANTSLTLYGVTVTA